MVFSEPTRVKKRGYFLYKNKLANTGNILIEKKANCLKFVDLTPVLGKREEKATGHELKNC
jgi:hypothetical protein